MRYGLLRACRDLPPPAFQRWLFESAGCDQVIEEGPPTPEAQQRLAAALDRLQSGDELFVSHLQAFQQTTGELIGLLLRLLKAGVVLRLIRSPVDVVTPGDVGTVLALLAEHHQSRRGPQALDEGMREDSEDSRGSLSRHQINHARKLLRQGASFRSVGMLFKLSPEELRDELTR